MRIIHKAATSQSLYVEVLDSTSTTGVRKTGLLFNTTSLTAYYVRNGASATAITLATLAAANSAWSSGGFKEVDATNMPGVYRLDVPDAAFATGADSVVVTLKGATGMVQVSEEVQLVGVDPQDATAFGVSRIDAAITSRQATVTFPTNFSSLAIDASGRVTVGSIVNGAIAAATFAANALGAVWDELRASHTTANTFGQGVASVQGNVTGSVASVTGAVGSVTAGVTVTTNNDKTGYALSAAGVQAIWDALTTALTTVGSVGKRIADFLTGDAYVRLGAPAGVSVSADIASVKTDTTTLTGRLTAGRATNLDNLDATVSSRLATSGYTAPPTAATVSTQVWTEPIPGAFAAGSAGAKLNSASAAGDPWGTAVPGAYAAGTAGNILGNRLDVAVSTRATSAGAGGAGALTFTYTVYKPDGTTPLQDCEVWVSTDLAGTNVVAGTLNTNALGQVVFKLDAGTYYFWRHHSAYRFVDPDQEVVS